MNQATEKSEPKKIKKVKCPKCGGRLIPVHFRGYYDELFVFMCENDCLAKPDCEKEVVGAFG